MRVEIDTRDLVKLVKQFTIGNKINDKDMLDDIEQILTYAEDEDFEHDIDIVEF